jgi:GTPase SAR1 family protein
MPQQALRTLFIGDEKTNKSQLLSSLVSSLSLVPPSRFDDFEVTISINPTRTEDESHTLALYDASGTESLDLARPLIYGHTKVVVLVFSLTSVNSYKSVVEKWVPEIRQYLPHVPIVLVGTHKEERDAFLQCVKWLKGMKGSDLVADNEDSAVVVVDNEACNEATQLVEEAGVQEVAKEIVEVLDSEAVKEAMDEQVVAEKVVAEEVKVEEVVAEEVKVEEVVAEEVNEVTEDAIESAEVKDVGCKEATAEPTKAKDVVAEDKVADNMVKISAPAQRPTAPQTPSKSSMKLQSVFTTLARTPKNLQAKFGTIKRTRAPVKTPAPSTPKIAEESTPSQLRTVAVDTMQSAFTTLRSTPAKIKSTLATLPPLSPSIHGLKQLYTALATGPVSAPSLDIEGVVTRDQGKALKEWIGATAYIEYGGEDAARDVGVQAVMAARAEGLTSECSIM